MDVCKYFGIVDDTIVRDPLGKPRGGTQPSTKPSCGHRHTRVIPGFSTAKKIMCEGDLKRCELPPHARDEVKREHGIEVD